MFSIVILFVDLFCHLPMQVYDVTQYLDDHPGGDDVILAATGTFLSFLYSSLPFGLHANLSMEKFIQCQYSNLNAPFILYFNEGKDATEEFEDAGHSKSARELMEQYCIGELDPSSPVSTYSEKFMQLTKQYWAVPVTVVGISVVVGFLYLRKK